jgi:hypothetical protein
MQNWESPLLVPYPLQAYCGFSFINCVICLFICLLVCLGIQAPGIRNNKAPKPPTGMVFPPDCLTGGTPQFCLSQTLFRGIHSTRSDQLPGLSKLYGTSPCCSKSTRPPHPCHAAHTWRQRLITDSHPQICPKYSVVDFI